MDNVVFLFSKDAMSKDNLPLFGNKYWKTPNIDELARKGTVFRRHYTAGGSTCMSMTAMLSGHYPYEFKDRKLYIKVKPSVFPSIYDYYQQEGYECHLIWDITWTTRGWRFIREFGDENKTIVHNLDIAQETGKHTLDDPLLRNEKMEQETYRSIFAELEQIDLTKKQFIWMHLPHILKGRRCYMDDMDMVDEILGYVRKLVGDDSIYFTSDHGHMNMHKGLVGYGFCAYEPVINIPLITPRINDLEYVDTLTSNIDLPEIITKHTFPKRDFVVTDTAYYGQPYRITAITGDRYKYIYNKKDSSEELYDLEWDPDENYNILKRSYYEKNRRKTIIYDELYFYPYRKEAMEKLKQFREIKNEFWIKETWLFETYGMIRKRLSFLKGWYKKFFIF